MNDILKFATELCKEEINIDELSKSNKNYKVLSSAGYSKILSSTITTGVIKALNPTGLFRASASPSVLMQMGGGFGSAVMGATGIVGQAPFMAATASVFAPAIAMQIMAIISGEYYLHGINKQLGKILDELQDLKNHLYNETLGKIYADYDMIESICKDESPNENYIVLLNDIRRDLLSIYHSYKENIKSHASEMNISTADDTSNTKKLLTEIKDVIEQKDFMFFTNVVFASNYLLFLADTCLMRLYAKINDRIHFDMVMNRILNEKSKRKDECYAILSPVATRYEAKIQGNIEKHKENYSKPENKAIYDELREKREACFSLLNKMDNNDAIIKIQDYMNSEKEILFVHCENGEAMLLQEAA